MKIKDVALLAGIVGAGVLIFSKWDKIQDMFGAWGIGPGAPVRPPDTPWYVPPSVTPYKTPSGVDPDTLPEIMPIPPPSLPELVFPPLALLPHEPIDAPVMPTPPAPPSPLEMIFPPLALLRSPLRRIRSLKTGPSYTPGPNIYQPSPDVPSDPGHPSTDPFIGGR